MGSKKKSLGIGIVAVVIIAIFILNFAPGLQAAEPGGSFSDIAATDPDLAYIKYLASQDIIKGYPDGKFLPQTGLTRAQAAVVMVKAGKISLDQNAISPFKDVKANHWARPYIAAAVKAGYISGYPNKTFQPDQPLSRAQGISLLLKLSKQPLKAALPALKDINSQHWAAQAVAVGLACGMVGLSADRQNYYPDGPLTRINMAHALGILLTEEPTLSASSLVGTLKTVQGQTVIIRNGAQTEEKLKETAKVNVGDLIITAKGASAELSYPDGSSMLIKEDSKISIKEARGRKYIKTNGQEGIAIDWLNLDMKQGTMFTALATKHEGSEASATTGKNPSNLKGKTLTAFNGRKLIAEAAQGSNQEMPWYEVAKTKKVKVKVDMPWGVAAVRGTFVMINVAPSGQSSVSCLTGTAEVTNGGQTVPLGQNQATQLATETSAPPQPVPMTPAAVQQFAQVQTWIEQTAQTMDQVQEQAPPPPPVAVMAPVQQAPVQQTTAPTQPATQPITTAPIQTNPVSALSALQAVNRALTSLGLTPGTVTSTPPATTPTTTTSTTSSNSSSSSTTPAVTDNALGQSVAVTAGTMNFVGGIKINLGSMTIPANATVKVENYTPTQLGDLQSAGPVLSIQFSNLTISQPVQITLPVTAGVDTSKAGIYYYNEAMAKWEYQSCQLVNGVLTATISHFSVYGVLLDTTAPGNLSLQAGTPTGGSVVLTWSAQDSSGIASYELYRDSTLIYSGSDTSYTDSNLTAGQTYNYQFKALDVRNNTSALSQAVTVPIPALPLVQITGLQNISTVNGHASIDYQVSPAEATVSYSYSPASGFGTPGSGNGASAATRWWMVDNANQTVVVTVTASKAGYTPLSQSFTVTAVDASSAQLAMAGANISITQAQDLSGVLLNGSKQVQIYQGVDLLKTASCQFTNGAATLPVPSFLALPVTYHLQVGIEGITNKGAIEYAPGSWSQLGGFAIAASGVSQTALINFGAPYVTAENNTEVLMSYIYNGNRQTLQIPGGLNNSLAGSGASNIAMAYQANGGIMVKKYDGYTWSNLASPGNGTETSLSEGNNGPYVAYKDSATANIMCKLYNGSAWATLGKKIIKDSAISLDVWQASINESPVDIPYMAGTASGATRVYIFRSNDWYEIGPAISVNSTLNSLAVHKGLPFIACTQGTDITVWMSLGQQGWQQLGQFSGSGAKLTVANSGTVYLTYIDAAGGTNLMKSTYMGQQNGIPRYVWTGGRITPAGTQDTCANTFINLGNITIARADANQVSVASYNDKLSEVIFNPDNYSLYGTDTTMEYSLDGGSTFTGCSGSCVTMSSIDSADPLKGIVVRIIANPEQGVCLFPYIPARLLAAGNGYMPPVPGSASGTVKINGLTGCDNWWVKVQNGPGLIPIYNGMVNNSEYTAYVSGQNISCNAGQQIQLLGTDSDGRIKAFACIPVTDAILANLIFNQDGMGYSGMITAKAITGYAFRTVAPGWPSGAKVSSNNFSGGVFDGQNIWLVPSQANQTVKLSLTSPLVMTGYSLPDSVDYAYNGGVFDGEKIWFVPYNENVAAVVYKQTEVVLSYNGWPMTLAKNANSFIGGAFDGQNIWLAPYSADRVVKINKDTGTMTGYNNWPDGFTKSAEAFSGAVFDGQNIWLVPCKADRVIKINKDTGTMTSYSGWPSGLTKGLYGFFGGAFDGKNIWLAPRSANMVVKIDKNTGDMTGYNDWPSGYNNPTDNRFLGAVYDGQTVWLIPCSANAMVGIDIQTGVMTGYSNTLTPGNPWDFQGGVFDGKDIYLVPQNASEVVSFGK